MSLYWIIDLVLLLPLLALSFHKKINFVSKWKFVFPAIVIVYLFMIVWEHFFIEWGVWFFNVDYISSVFLFGVPIEEHVFIWALSFASVFVYESMTLVFQRDYLGRYSIAISIVICLLMAWLYYMYYTRLYMGIASGCASFLLIQHIFVFRSHWRYMGHFFVAYALMLVPITIIYWILASLPVILYNTTEEIGLQFGKIPLENYLYYLFQFLCVITIYELLKKKFIKDYSLF